MIAREAMCARVQCVFPEVPISEVTRIMRENRLVCMAVVTDGELLGMISEEDLTRATAGANDLGDVTAGDVMVRPAFSCFDDEEMEKVTSMMRNKNFQRLIVLTDHRSPRVIGVLSTDSI